MTRKMSEHEQSIERIYPGYSKLTDEEKEEFSEFIREALCQTARANREQGIVNFPKYEERTTTMTKDEIIRRARELHKKMEFKPPIKP